MVRPVGSTNTWSGPSSGEMALLLQDDWAPLRWIEHAGRTENQPMPIFARQFTVGREVSRARLHLPTLNGRKITDEVSAPASRTTSFRASTGPATSLAS